MLTGNATININSTLTFYGWRTSAWCTETHPTCIVVSHYLTLARLCSPTKPAVTYMLTSIKMFSLLRSITKTKQQILSFEHVMFEGGLHCQQLSGVLFWQYIDFSLVMEQWMSLHKYDTSQLFDVKMRFMCMFYKQHKSCLCSSISSFHLLWSWIPWTPLLLTINKEKYVCQMDLCPGCDRTHLI